MHETTPWMKLEAWWLLPGMSDTEPPSVPLWPLFIELEKMAAPSECGRVCERRKGKGSNFFFAVIVLVI